LLNRLGVNARRDAAPVPCNPDGSASAGNAAPAAAPAASTPAASAPAAPARSGGFFRGLREQSNSGQSRRNCGAVGAGCADGMKPLVACMDEVSFWSEMAVHVERKRDTGTWTP